MLILTAVLGIALLFFLAIKVRLQAFAAPLLASCSVAIAAGILLLHKPG